MSFENFIKGLIYGEGYTIARLLREARNSERDLPKASTFSTLLKTKRIRYSTVRDIAEFLGYEIVFRKK